MIHKMSKSICAATFFVGTLIVGERAYQVIRYHEEQRKAKIVEKTEHGTTEGRK
jgi:hypothetical protein